MWDLNNVYIKKDSLKYRQTVNGNALVIDMESGNLLELNETGYDIFLRIDGILSLNDLIQDIKNDYDASDDIVEDIINVVDKLYRADFLILK